jgi:hypothetical protein
MPTASAVVGDLLNTVSGGYPKAFATMNLWGQPDSPAALPLIDPQQQPQRYYLRLKGLDRPGTMGRITATLGEVGISLSAVMQHEEDAGQYVPIVVTTHDAPGSAIQEALRRIQSLEVTQGEPVCLPLLRMPRG